MIPKGGIRREGYWRMYKIAANALLLPYNRFFCGVAVFTLPNPNPPLPEAVRGLPCDFGRIPQIHFWGARDPRHPLHNKNR